MPEPVSSFPQRPHPQPPEPAVPRDLWIDYGPSIPVAYGRDMLVLLVRDPRCVYSYWELDGPGTRGAGGVEGTVRLTLEPLDGGDVQSPLLDPACGGFYFVVRPHTRYRARLEGTQRDGSRLVLVSNEVRTPRAGPCAPAPGRPVRIGAADLGFPGFSEEERTWPPPAGGGAVYPSTHRSGLPG